MSSIVILGAAGLAKEFYYYVKRTKPEITNFIFVNDYKLIHEIYKVVEIILTNEFSLIIDLYDNVIFEKNTQKLKGDYILEALEIIGQPSRINEIYNLIEKKHPNVFTNIDAIRGQIPKNGDIIFFGNKSTYGLKKWQSNKNQIFFHLRHTFMRTFLQYW
jgi:hypothetical protein